MANLVTIINLPYISSNGCEVTKASATTLTINSGIMRDYSNTFDITITDPLTLDSSVIGADGIDTGTVAINSFYAVYVIYDATNSVPPKCLMSLSSNAPIMPSVGVTTFTTYRLVGYVKTDGVGEFLDFTLCGNANERVHTWDVPISVLSGGSATTFTAVDLSAALPNAAAIANNPQTSMELTANVSFTPNVGGEFVSFIGGASTAVAGTVELSASVSTVPQTSQLSLIADFVGGTNYSLQYKNSAGTGATSMFVSGFRYFI